MLKKKLMEKIPQDMEGERAWSLSGQSHWYGSQR
jgi:hypothetical protein